MWNRVVIAALVVAIPTVALAMGHPAPRRRAADTHLTIRPTGMVDRLATVPVAEPQVAPVSCALLFQEIEEKRGEIARVEAEIGENIRGGEKALLNYVALTLAQLIAEKHSEGVLTIEQERLRRGLELQWRERRHAFLPKEREAKYIDLFSRLGTMNCS